MKAAIYQRTCPICEACCGLVIAKGADGKIASIKGDPDDPFSQGFLCPKSQAMLGLATDPDRLTKPLKRVGDRFVEIDWREAFDHAAERLGAVRDVHGGGSVGFYIGNPTANNPGLGLYSGALIGPMATRQVYTASSVDAHPRLLTSALVYGDKSLVPLPDVDHCDFLIIIGANPMISNGSMWTAPGVPRRLKAMRDRGGKIVVVDPRRTETADIADQHLSIQPSTDALLLLAMANALFDEGLVNLGTLEPVVRDLEAFRTIAGKFPPEDVAKHTGIAANDIRMLARDLARAERGAVYGRVGACCQIFGTLTNWLLDMLNLLTGNLDRQGGMVFGRPIPSNALVREGYVVDQAPYDRYRTRVRGFPEFNRQYPAFVLAEEIETPGEGQLRAFVSMAGNPLLTHPNGERLERALRSLEFMVSIDFYMNETSRLADLILPPISPLERSGFPLHFSNYMVRSYAKYSPAVLPKPEGAYDDWEILLEISSRLAGVERDLFHCNFLLGVIGRVQQATGEGTDRSPEEILEMLADEPGPDRIFDLLVRAGEFGDHFGDAPEGLTLDKLRDHPHGIDLGPVGGGRFPGRLATPDRMIRMAPPAIVGDIARLKAFRAEGGFDAPPRDGRQFVLTSRRDMRSMNSWLHNIHAFAKGRDRCTLMMHPEDADRLGLAEGQILRVSNATGAVEVPVQITRQVRPGAVNMPHGFGHDLDGSELNLARIQPGRNVNLLLDEESIDVPSGNTAFNSILVSVEAL